MVSNPSQRWCISDQWMAVGMVRRSDCLFDQLCPTLCHPMDCSLPGSAVHGLSQARILECVAIPFFRGSSQIRDWIHTSCISRWVLYHWATREAQEGISVCVCVLEPTRFLPNLVWNNKERICSRKTCFVLKWILSINSLNTWRARTNQSLFIPCNRGLLF